MQKKAKSLQTKYYEYGNVKVLTNETIPVVILAKNSN